MSTEAHPFLSPKVPKTWHTKDGQTVGSKEDGNTDKCAEVVAVNGDTGHFHVGIVVLQTHVEAHVLVNHIHAADAGTYAETAHVATIYGYSRRKATTVVGRTLLR